MLFIYILFLVYCYFFFFKQKTAYDMRISDWSSDVCSSDLLLSDPGGQIARRGDVKLFLATEMIGDGGHRLAGRSCNGSGAGAIEAVPAEQVQRASEQNIWRVSLACHVRHLFVRCECEMAGWVQGPSVPTLAAGRETGGLRRCALARTDCRGCDNIRTVSRHDVDLMSHECQLARMAEPSLQLRDRRVPEE